MRFVVPAVLLIVAAIHLLPLAGVLGGERLLRLYGVAPGEPNLELLLRHRALLFGLLAAFLAYAALRPELHRLALVAAAVSVGSFLVLAGLTPALNAALGTVFRVDVAALALLAVAAVVHVLQAR